MTSLLAKKKKVGDHEPDIFNYERLIQLHNTYIISILLSHFFFKYMEKKTHRTVQIWSVKIMSFFMLPRSNLNIASTKHYRLGILYFLVEVINKI